MSWVVVISCYTCATMCSWPENLCTPGVVQCTVFYMLWHFRTLEGKEKGVSVVISCYICATVCGWARIFMILNAPLGLCNVQCSICCGILRT